MKVKVSIPSDASEMKLKDYQKYIKATEENEDEHFLTLKLIEVFTGLTLAQVEAMPLNDIEEIATVLINALNEKPKFEKFFTMNGKKFGFIPDLDNISAGEYGDLESYLTDPQNLHKVLAILYRPVTKEKNGMYLIEKYEGSSKYSFEMKDAPVSIMLGAIAFFLTLGKELVKHILLYLEKEMENQPTVQRRLAQSGVGMDYFTQSLEAMYFDSMKLPNLDYTPS